MSKVRECIERICVWERKADTMRLDCMCDELMICAREQGYLKK